MRGHAPGALLGRAHRRGGQGLARRGAVRRRLLARLGRGVLLLGEARRERRLPHRLRVDGSKGWAAGGAGWAAGGTGWGAGSLPRRAAAGWRGPSGPSSAVGARSARSARRAGRRGGVWCRSSRAPPSGGLHPSNTRGRCPPRIRGPTGVALRVGSGPTPTKSASGSAAERQTVAMDLLDRVRAAAARRGREADVRRHRLHGRRRAGVLGERRAACSCGSAPSTRPTSCATPGVEPDGHGRSGEPRLGASWHPVVLEDDSTLREWLERGVDDGAGRGQPAAVTKSMSSSTRPSSSGSRSA